ncbi:MAG: cation:dicarboxylase symporter family transporter [Bdellovibrionaceae bacterium]|nr:cation:dicarboxylase symporter family transporter [Pseudobdellovibrionaceae bacterium]
MWKFITSLKMTTWIFIALVVGLLIGVYLPETAHMIKPFRTLFLNGVKCIIAPLIFASVVTGINSAGSVSGLGKTGLRAILWFELATTMALVIGLVFVNWLKPGSGLSIGSTHVTQDIVSASQTTMSLEKFIEHILPTNFAEAIVKGDVLQIVLFSVIFGVAILLAGEKAKPVLLLCTSLNEIMFKFTEIIMYLAPIGVGAAIAGSVAEHGLAVLLPMAKLVGTLYLALVVFVITVLVPALIYAKVKIKKFFLELRPSLVLAFATTSSESAYPMAFQSLENMGIKNRIASFVLPLGYSFNLDGSTLYLAIASVFISQAAGIELSVGTQITMMLTLMLTTKGVAAVPRASLVVLSATLTAFGLPLEGLVLIIGVDEFMDMARTTVNLLGNCVATTVVARWEREPLFADYQHLTD